MNNEELLDHIQALKLKRDMLVITYNGLIEEASGKLEAQLKKDHLPKLKTTMATAYWQNSTKAEVKDWNAVMEFVYANKAFDILQRRIAPAQLEKRLNAGAKLDGVTITHDKTFIIKSAADKGDKDE